MKKQLKKVVGLLFVSSVLIACGQQNPGTAAFVGDTRITSDQLSVYMDDLRVRCPN
jgi:hypothetical protein